MHMNCVGLRLSKRKHSPVDRGNYFGCLRLKEQLLGTNGKCLKSYVKSSDVTTLAVSVTSTGSGARNLI